MPNPARYKDRNKYMDDCMHQMVKVEKKPQDQAVAVCLSRSKEVGKKSKKKCSSEILKAVAQEIISHA